MTVLRSFLATALSVFFAAGLFDLGFAVFHVAFWWLFGWPERLRLLDRFNQALVPVMNVAPIALFTSFGLTLVAASHGAVTTVIGRWLLGGIGFFWFVRAVVQVPYFGFKHPASILLTALFVLGLLLRVRPLLAGG